LGHKRHWSERSARRRQHQDGAVARAGALRATLPGSRATRALENYDSLMVASWTKPRKLLAV